MKLFPEDIATAEVLTGGNPNIIHDDMFLPEKRPSYAADFAPTPKKTPKKIKIERKKETPQSKPVTPRVITHPRFIRHGICDYEARERRQVPLRAECDEEDNSPPTTYRCHDCSFSTIRLNVLILHNKAHLKNYANQHTSSKGVKKKSSVVRFKERKTIESEFKPKVPKTSEKPKPKVTKKTPVKRVAENTTPENDKLVVKKKRPQGNTDEFQNSLLQDWADFDNDAENDLPSNEDSNSLSGDLNDSMASTASSSKTSQNRKSCFDFDDSEDGLVIDKSKIRAGRKIPRVLDDSKVDKTDDDEPASSEALEDTVNSADDNEDGIDSISDAFSETPKTSLQEMGVDNEIEIDSEETEVKDGVDTTVGSVQKTKEQEKAEREAEELKQKVDKLLEEVSAPPKLPDIPYSVKKAHIKSFNEAEELARREAEKTNPPAEEPELEPEPEPKTDIEANSVSEEKPIEPPELVETSQSQDNEVIEEQSNEIEQKSEENSTEVPDEPETDTPVQEVIQPVAEITEDTPIEIADEDAPEITPPAGVIENSIKTPIKVVVGSVSSTSQSIVLPLCNNTTPVKTLPASVKLSTTPTFKLINVGANVKSAAQIAKVITTGDKNQIINKIQSVDGKNVVCLQSPQKFVINKSKTIILNRDSASKLLNCQNVPTAVKLPTTSPRPTGQKVRLFTPNILQKTARTVTRTPTKMVLPSNIQTSNVVLLQPQKPIVITGVSTESATVTSTVPAPQQSETDITYLSNDGKSYQVVSAANQLFTVQSNNVYIDSSGNVLNVDEPPCVTTKEDILAKALENTDVLQTEITVDASQSVLDTISVAQNTPIIYKGEPVYETNLTLNTPPIMSAFETPSRAVNSATVSESVCNEMIIISGNSENNEYV